MDPAAMRAALSERAAAVRAGLADRWEPGRTRTREIAVPGVPAPVHPDDLFPWVSLCLVFDGDGQVLLVRDDAHDSLDWEPPGGRGEQEETPERTARREVCEETGVECELRGLPLVETLEFDYGAGERFPVVQAVFTGRHRDGEPRPAESGIAEARWFPRESLPRRTQYRNLVTGLD